MRHLMTVCAAPDKLRTPVDVRAVAVCAIAEHPCASCVHLARGLSWCKCQSPHAGGIHGKRPFPTTAVMGGER